MKIAVISFYKSFPPDSGVSNVTYNVTRFLSGKKYLIQLSDDRNSTKIDRNTDLINIKGNSDNRFLKAVNLSLHFPIIVKKLKELGPHVVILEGASWALYYLILLYLVKRNRIKARVIYHAHNVEYLLRKQKNNSMIALITKWAEKKLMIKSHLSFAVSEIDASSFKRIYGIMPFMLPNGVDDERFDKVTDEEIIVIKKKYDLRGKIVMFMGMPSFKPNKEAIDFLIKNVFSLVIKEYPEAKLAVIGGEIEYKKEWLINPGNIPFEEVPVFIKACDVCVAPIFSGSGTRLKILECMAAGRPVISTTKGAEGIAVTNNKNIVIAENADEFREKILYLLKHPEIGNGIGKEGKTLVRANYSWERIIADFEKTLYSFITERKEYLLVK